MFWDNYSHWQDAELAWDQKAKTCEISHPLKILSTLPKMPGIAEPGIKRKGLFYLLRSVRKKIFWRHFFRSPIRYGWQLFRSYLKKKTINERAIFFSTASHRKKSFLITLQRIYSSAFRIAINRLNAPLTGSPINASTTQSIPSAASALSESALTPPLSRQSSSGSPPSTTSAKRFLTQSLKTQNATSASSSPPAKCLSKCSATGEIWSEPKGSASDSMGVSATR